MKKQTLIWTALPHRMQGTGGAGSQMELAIMVAPRLWNDDPTVTQMPLSDFVDWLEWTETVKGASLEIRFDNGDNYTVTPDTTLLDTNKWRALFKSDTVVYPFAFEDISGAELLSPDFVGLHEAVKGIYQDVATDPAYGLGTELPTIGQLATHPTIRDIAEPSEPEPPFVPPPDTTPPPHYEGTEPPSTPDPTPPVEPGVPVPPQGCGCGPVGCLLTPLRLLWVIVQFVVRLLIQIVRKVLALLGSAAALPPMGGSSLKSKFDTLRAFLDTNQVANPNQPSEGEPLPGAEQLDGYDFHKMVSLLGDYPVLQRLTGLVLPVSFTLTAPLPAQGTVQVIPTLPLADPATHASPRTHYELATDFFYARPRPVGSELAKGLLRLNTTAFDVQQVEITGSTVKLQNTATQMVYLQQQGKSPLTPEDQGLAAQQTAGLVLVQQAIAPTLTVQFRHNYALNKHLAALDGSPVAAYKGAGGDPPADDSLFAEDLVRGYRLDVWDNRANRWRSLCLRRGTYTFIDHPGGAVTVADLPEEGFVQLAVTEPLKPVPTRRLHVPELLATWRGWSLSAPRPMRTILVDEPPATPGDPYASTLGTPDNAALTAFKLETTFRAEPKSLPRLRYDYTYRLRARMVDWAGNSVFDPSADPTAPFQTDVSAATTEITFRRFEPIAPPPVMLRALPKEGESLDRLTVRSRVDDTAAVIEAQTTLRHVLPPTVAQHITEYHGLFDSNPAMRSDQMAYDLASREASTATHRLTWNPADPTDRGALVPLPNVTETPLPDTTQDKVWVNSNELAKVAYLPDPYAQGVLLLGVPGLTAGEIIEPGVQIVNKIPFDGVYPDLRPFRLRVQGISAGQAPTAPVWDAPTRTLTLQLPQGETFTVRISCYLDSAEVAQLGMWGWMAEKLVADPVLLGQIQADVEAGKNWLLMPWRTLTLVHAVQQPLALAAITTLDPAPDPMKTPGATSAALRLTASIDAKSTSKLDLHGTWEDFHDDLARPDFDATTDIVPSAMHVDEELLPDTTNDAPVFDLNHVIGDTKYHHITYHLVATTRFREYFPAAITADPQNLIRPMVGEVAPTIALDIPNSACPAAPKVLYILPTFAWESETVGDLTTHTRRGAGVRVYMERPWFSSGNGELLGVVMRPPSVVPNDNNLEWLRKVTSEWGEDPVWAGVPTPPLQRSDLTLTDATVGNGLMLAETNLFTVDAVGYAPVYDPTRHLWFCDIPLQDHNYYTPFLRLAFARFQPISIAGAHLSAVVLADYVQPAPRRSVTYDLSQTATDKVAITARGPAGAHIWLRQAITTRWRAYLQKQVFPDVPPEEALGWQTIGSMELERVGGDAAELVWDGTLDLPKEWTSPLRIVLAESEPYLSDTPNEPAADAPLPIKDVAQIENERVVFVDTLLL